MVSDPVHDALLKAVFESPDDDLPRLAYADWLEEHGGAADALHAELIRLQLWLHRQEPCYSLDYARSRATHSKSAVPEIRRALELADAYLVADNGASAWVGCLPEFERGFVRRATLDRWFDAGALCWLARRHPLTGIILWNFLPWETRSGYWSWAGLLDGQTRGLLGNAAKNLAAAVFPSAQDALAALGREILAAARRP